MKHGLGKGLCSLIERSVYFELEPDGKLVARHPGTLEPEFVALIRRFGPEIEGLIRGVNPVELEPFRHLVRDVREYVPLSER